MASRTFAGEASIANQLVNQNSKLTTAKQQLHQSPTAGFLMHTHITQQHRPQHRHYHLLHRRRTKLSIQSAKDDVLLCMYKRRNHFHLPKGILRSNRRRRIEGSPIQTRCRGTRKTKRVCREIRVPNVIHFGMLCAKATLSLEAMSRSFSASSSLKS